MKTVIQVRDRLCGWGRKKSMQHMLLEVKEVAEQCVIVVLDELS